MWLDMHVYSGTFLIWTPLGQKKASLLVRCSDFRGCNVHKQGVWDSKVCPVYQGVLISGCPEKEAPLHIEIADELLTICFLGRSSFWILKKFFPN